MTEQQSGSPSKEGMSRHTMDLSHTLNCDYLIVTLHNSFPGLNAIMFVMGHFMDTCLGFSATVDMLPVEMSRRKCILAILANPVLRPHEDHGNIFVCGFNIPWNLL